MRDVEKLLLDQMAKTSWNFRKLCKFKIFIEYLTLLFAAFSKRSVAVVVCGQPTKLVWSAEMPKDFSIFPYSFSALSFPRSTAGQMPQVDWLADRRTDKQTDRETQTQREQKQIIKLPTNGWRSRLFAFLAYSYCCKRMHINIYWVTSQQRTFVHVLPPSLGHSHIFLFPHFFNLHLSAPLVILYAGQAQVDSS